MCYHLLLTMKESLDIPKLQDGAVWHYQATGRRYPMHRHDELELNVVLGGEGGYLVGDRRYELRHRSMLWLFAGQEHVLLHQSRDFQMWIMILRPEVVERACPLASREAVLREADPGGDFCRRVPIEAAGRVCDLAVEAAEGYARGAIGLANAALVHAVLAAWAAYDEAPVLGAESVHPAVRRAADYLCRPTASDAIEPVAEFAGLSASRLSHLFHEQTGLTLTAYRNRQRLERFLQLYGAGHRRDMQSTALAAGFGSYAQFHRVFTDLMGCGPRQYQRQRLR